MEITWRAISWEEEGREEREEDTRIKKHNWWVQNRWEEVKNSIGNYEAKELICMTHGHELRVEDWQREWWVLGRGRQREKIGTPLNA